MSVHTGNESVFAAGVAGTVGYKPDLTKRELFAALIMQGLVQDPNMTTMRTAAKGAVEGANELIAALLDEVTP